MPSHTKPEYSKRYIELNYDKIAAAKKLDYLKNREEILARQKAWREANPEAQREIAKRAREGRKEKAAAEQKAWRLKNPEKVAAARLLNAARPEYKRRKMGERLKKYGITVEAFEAMASLQNNKCGICETDNPGINKRWSVDHDHVTDAVRGLLCQNCNLALGQVGDDITILEKMIDYLKRHKNGP